MFLLEVAAGVDGTGRASHIPAIVSPEHRPKGPRSQSARRARAGVSLLEAAAILSGAGVLLAAFVPTFLDHVRLSKISEATEQLEALHRGAAAYYASEQRVGGKLVHGCLPDSAGPMPESPAIDPVAVDFAASDTIGRATWNALGVSDTRDLRYSYSVIVSKPGCAPHDITPGAAVITLRAEGDLDGDGVKSLIERTATLSTDQRTLVPVPPLRVERRVE